MADVEKCVADVEKCYWVGTVKKRGDLGVPPPEKNETKPFKTASGAF